MIYFEPGFVGNDYNLNHPRILWNSLCRRGTVAASSSAAGFPAVNAATATTYDKWKPSALPAWWKLTFAAETISAVAIDTHTIGSAGASVAVQEWNGSSWVDLIAAVTPENDDPIAFLFEERETDRIRLHITGAPAPQIAVIHVCKALELPRRVYGGVATPVDMAAQTEFETTQSAEGQYLGRSVMRMKRKNDFAVAHLKEAYVRGEMKPFFADARTYPYFLLERPYQTPDALSYRWRDQDIQPQRMGVRDFMEVSL